MRYLLKYRSLTQLVYLSSFILIIGLCLISVLTYLYHENYAALIVGLSIYVFGQCVGTAPFNRLILYSTPISKGTASAVISFIFMIIIGVGNEVGGLIYHSNRNLYFALFCSACGALYLICFYFWKKDMKVQNYYKKTFFYLALLSFGISICFTFQLSNLSNLFKFLGASTDNLPWLWLAPPLTGLFVQPLIGQLSDDTNTRFGKRQPYIMAGGLFVILAFVSLALNHSLGLAVVLIWIIDCGLNTCCEALRALTGDLTSKEQRASAFALQAFIGGIGSALGAGLAYFFNKFLTYIKVSAHVIPNRVPANFQYSFIFCAVALLLTLIICFKQLQERPFKKQSLLSRKKQSSVKKTMPLKKVLPNLFFTIKKMPSIFQSICIAHALTWTSIFIFWLYLPIVIAHNFFHLPANADVIANPAYADILNKASLLSSAYLPVYLYTSVIYSVVIYFIADYFDKIKLHTFALVIGSLGLIMASFASSLPILCIGLVAIGIMWGSLIILPYSLVMDVFPKGKLGVYLGIFNISITIPQIACGLLLPSVYKYVFNSKAEYVLCFAGVVMFLSAISWLRQAKNYYAGPKASDQLEVGEPIEA